MNPLAPALLLAVFFGGGFGSVMRHAFGVSLNGKAALPLGTLAANLAATARRDRSRGQVPEHQNMAVQLTTP